STRRREMPSAQQHEDQRDHNKRLLAEPVLAGTAYLDWQVTVTFYAAVHHVEAALALRGVYPMSHKERRDAVRRNWRTVFKTYDTLYQRSCWARYECYQIQPQHVAEARAALAAIESRIS